MKIHCSVANLISYIVQVLNISLIRLQSLSHFYKTRVVSCHFWIDTFVLQSHSLNNSDIQLLYKHKFHLFQLMSLDGEHS